MTDIEKYKGVRDFYPNDMFIQNYMFDVMRAVCESYGYQEYNASILELTDLYTKKSSDEIVNEQTYTFEDRGGRSVTLRPEMTPSVARMVASKKRELTFPLRWYCIQNFFRYERPQRGRQREFWQLNADLFGISSIDADVEMISLANDIMENFGATDQDFSIHVNNRGSLKQSLMETMSEEDAEHELTQMDKGKTNTNLKDVDPGEDTNKVLTQLRARGITNVEVDPSLIRGFSYYTGTIFEIFDADPKNNRSMFGGGRYDKLVEKYGNESVPAVGFAMGDVTLRDFLDSHELLPDVTTNIDVYVATVNEESKEAAHILARKLRASGLNVVVNVTEKHLGDQIKYADKSGIPNVVTVGEKEIQLETYPLKNLESGEEETVSASDIIDRLS